MDSFLDFLSPEIMDLLNKETSDSEQTLVTGQVDPAIQQEQLTGHSVHDYNLEPSTKRQKRTFAPRKNEDEVMKAKLSAIPSKTMADTNYGVNVWQQWCAHISTEYGEEVIPLKEISTQELSTKLSLFVFEVRKQNGEEFPPNSLLHLVAGIQRYIRIEGRPSIDFFKDSQFSEFRMCLDAEMKRLRNSGLGSKTKKPSLYRRRGNFMAERTLGKSNPQALLDTIWL